MGNVAELAEIFASVVLTGSCYFCYGPYVLCCNRFDHSSRHSKREPVDLVKEDCDITLRWQIAILGVSTHSQIHSDRLIFRTRMLDFQIGDHRQSEQIFIHNKGFSINSIFYFSQLQIDQQPQTIWKGHNLCYDRQD